MQVPYTEKIDYLLERARRLLNDPNRLQLLSFFQEVAENFYPERADFTVTSQLGQDFARDSSTSYPFLVHRDLSNHISSILRPVGTTWMDMETNRPAETIDGGGQQWLEMATKVQWNAMTDRAAKMDRATKEGDRDYVAFGQCVLSAEYLMKRQQLLYRCWHLRDVAWCENAYGDIYFIARKWSPTAQDLVDIYGAQNCSTEVNRLVTEKGGVNKWQKVEVIHIVCMTAEYQPPMNPARYPWVSLMVDVAAKVVMDATPMPTKFYVIPRWETIAGSQYALSPAVIVGLPDARLLQEMAYTLLRASQKYVDPPTLGVMEAVRGDLALYPGGHTWVDSAYEGKLEEALRPLTQDSRAFPIGANQSMDTRAQLASAFYLDKLQLPRQGPQMTAEEIRARIQQYIREASPLFQPILTDYNGQLCDETFVLIMANGGFGPREAIPQSLRGAEVRFRFESPLMDAEEVELPRTFLDAKALALEAEALEPGSSKILKAQEALRSALRGRKTPADWLRGEDEMEQITQQAADQLAQAQQIQQAQKLAAVADTGASAVKQSVDANQIASQPAESAQ